MYEMANLHGLLEVYVSHNPQLLVTDYYLKNLYVDESYDEKVKQDIWHWFDCKPDCSLEEGLTIVENVRDVKKMYEMANLHGLLEVYVSHNPQLLLTDYYLKNLYVDESYDESEMEAKEDQDAVFDSLDGLMDNIKMDSDVLVAVTQLQELVKSMICEKENNVKFMNLAD
uniref:Transposase, MuDR, MULE transposase domain protein n=1 Tax=Tanacetum cinerariifolium TaxID=118510 RepID=A0A6L2K312_TANCI|nr:transposase, MuDR, MULE transposase domain protein [Tanacetum cinerariifolium]